MLVGRHRGNPAATRCDRDARERTVSHRRYAIVIAVAAALAAGSPAPAGVALGQAPVPGSDTSTLSPVSGYGKPNQSRVWFNTHAARWDALVPRDLGQGSDHYVLKQVAGSRVFTGVLLEDRDDARPDVFWDDASATLWVLGSHAAASRLWRVSYSFPSDAYAIDPAVSGVVVPGLVHDAVSGENRPASLHVGPEGDVWVAAVRDLDVLVQHSSDGGESWGMAPLVLGQTALPAVTVWNRFEHAGATRLGLFVGENGAEGAVQTRFLYWTIDTQADPFSLASWSDESDAVPGPLGTESSDDHVSAARDAEGNQYFAVKTEAGDPGDPRIKLLRRTPAGAWSQFPVTTAEELPEQTRPSVVIDGENRRALVYTTRTGGGQGIRFEAPLDGLDSLATAAPVVVFSSPGTSFDDVIAPRGLVDSTSGIAVLAHDETDLTLWRNFESVPPSQAGRVIIAGFQSVNDVGNGRAEFVELFNTTGEAIALDGLDLVVRRDTDSDGDVEVYWRLSDLEPDLAGATIAPWGFFLVAETGVPAPGGVHDLELALDLPTGDGGWAERAISLELSIDDVHMDYVVYGRHDGSNSGAHPPGDIPFDGLSFPRSEVLRNTTSALSFNDGVMQRLTPQALHAGHDVPGFYADEAALDGDFPPGVWWSPHSPSYSDYVTRNSLSPPVPAACAADTDGDGTADCDDPDDDGDGAPDASDCAPGESGWWSVPGEVASIALEQLAGTTRIAWAAPVDAGGAALAYDLLLATDAPLQTATCAGTTELEQALVPAEPAPSGVFFFLVRAVNGCGDGPLGSSSNGVPREAPACR
jgi:hypothetical protein